MSLHSLVQRRGSTVTRYRATPTPTAGGSRNLVFAAVGTGEKFLLDAPDAQTKERLFGADVRCDLRAIVMKPDVALSTTEREGIAITAGWRAGEYYDITAVVDFDQGRRHAHYEVALVRRARGFA